MITQKAVRCQVSFGDISVEGFQLPDGSYRMSLTQVAELLGFKATKGSSFLALSVLETLTTKELQGSCFITEDTNQKIKGLTLDYVAVLFGYYAVKGNELAMPLMMAALTETLERRFDRAFDIKRTEDEYNDHTAARIKGKEARKKFTDQIKEWADETGIAVVDYGGFTSEIYRKTGLHWSFINYKKAYKDSKFRDTLDAETLRILERFEDNCVAIMYSRQLEPMAAINYTYEKVGLSRRRESATVVQR